jgi:hypothetical protein
MDNRKAYEAPAIEWEDALEQTSLSCAATRSWIDPTPGGPFESVSCGIDVTKNGSFVVGMGCTWIMFGPDDVVALS